MMEFLETVLHWLGMAVWGVVTLLFAVGLLVAMIAGIFGKGEKKQWVPPDMIDGHPLNDDHRR